MTNDDTCSAQRGKIRNIQFPAIKYFAYYIATSVLGRDNTSNISNYHLAFLAAALKGEIPFNLGTLIARRLAAKGPIYGGIIASCIVAHLRLPIDPNDALLAPCYLDLAAMKGHQFVTIGSTLEKLVFRFMFSNGSEREIPLSQPSLFSINRSPWSFSEVELDEQLNARGFHEQHSEVAPEEDYTARYTGASSSSYHGEGSSSRHEDFSSCEPWAPSYPPGWSHYSPWG